MFWTVFNSSMLTTTRTTRSHNGPQKPKRQNQLQYWCKYRKNLKDQKADITPEILLLGLKDAYTGAKTTLTEREMGEVLGQYQQEMMAKTQAESQKKAKEIK